MNLKTSKLILLILVISLCIPFMNSCENTVENSEEAKKFTIAVTILPEQELVEAVCGERANVITIVPLGSSPESYEPTTQQIEELAGADLYFSIGVPCEEAKSIAEPEKAVLVKLNEKAAAAYDELMFAENSRDPHIWLSPKRIVVMVNAIANEMSKLDPANAEEYKTNAVSYIAMLMQTSTYIKGLFKDLPEEDRVFLTFHPAYGYFADEYGLTMYSLEEEGKEATAQDLQDMIDFALENDIKVMFTQAESDSTQPSTFASEVGGETIVLNPLAKDYLENIKIMAEKIAGALK